MCTTVPHLVYNVRPFSGSSSSRRDYTQVDRRIARGRRTAAGVVAAPTVSNTYILITTTRLWLQQSSRHFRLLL